jgi:hypothetical protein
MQLRRQPNGSCRRSATARRRLPDNSSHYPAAPGHWRGASRETPPTHRAKVGLAKRLGWKQSSISEIETGVKRVNVLELVSVAQALGFDPNEALKEISKIEE